MVMTTSETSTASGVRIFGVSAEMSMPSSSIAATTAGFTVSAGADPAERTSTRPCAEVREVRGRHLGAPGVVHAHEQDGRLLGHRNRLSSNGCF